VWVATHWTQTWDFIKAIVKDAVNFILRFWYLLPFGWIIKSIVWVAQNWSSIWGWITSATSSAVNAIVGIALAIWNNGILPVWNLLVSFWNFWSGLWTGIANIITGIWNNYISPVITMIENAVSTISGAIGTVANVAKGIGGFIGKVGGFLGFEEGGFVPGTKGAPVLAVVHGGEYVVSNDMLAGRAPVHHGILASVGANSMPGAGRASSAAASAGNHQALEAHFHIHLDGKEIQHSVERHQLRVGARRGTTWQNYKR
jgi:hypothetical protein